MADELNALIFDEEVPLNPVTKSEIKKSIIIKAYYEHTYIFVLSFKPNKNRLTAISFKEKGTPIGGYTFDAKFGHYYVECYDYLDLGTIPVSFSIKIDKISRWERRIPLTESTIKKYLSYEQKLKLKEFRGFNKGCRLEFMQLISCFDMDE